MTTNTSAPADVLAVMRAAVMVTESHGLNETAWGLSDACAAVAELMDIARRCATSRPGGNPYYAAHADLREWVAKFG